MSRLKTLLLIVALSIKLASCTETKSAAATETTKNETKTKMTVIDKNDVVVNMSTTMGDIKILLFGDTPKHRDNFVKLVNEGYMTALCFTV